MTEQTAIEKYMARPQKDVDNYNQSQLLTELIEQVEAKKKKNWQIRFEGDLRPAFAVANKSFNKEVTEVVNGVLDDVIQLLKSKLGE